MPSQRARIYRDIKRFVPYMQDTDNYQRETDPTTTKARYLNWGWTKTHSDQWAAFRQRGDELFKKYNNKLKRSTDDTNNLHLLIKSVVQYDKANHLLNKIAATIMPPAVLKDFETFNIKRGTPLAVTKPTRVADGMSVPVIVIKNIEHLRHTLGISDPNKQTKGKGKNIREVQVWRAITEAKSAAPVANAYTHIGEVQRGSFKSEFTDDDVRKDAWYKARYKNTQGKCGEFSVAVSAVIF